MCTEAHLSHAFETEFMCHIMCAAKKPNSALWLTIWLSFERRKIFLETFATLPARVQLLHVGDVLKLVLLA